MRIGFVGLFMLLCPPVFAQQEMPPVIRFDSVLDPLKLPANLYFGEVSGIASTPRATSSSCRAATPPARPMPLPRRSSSSSAPTASTCARSAITSTLGPSPTWSRWNRTTTSGSPTKARTW